MATIQLLAFAGSLRTHSFNQGVLSHLVAGAEAAGAKVLRPEPGTLALPLYDGDLEAASGLPAKARAWQQLMAAHDGFLIAAPEYNGSITPLLKNAIDWASRPVTGASDSGRAVYEGRVAGLVGASQGALGGLRGLRHVREILTNLGVVVVPQQLAVTWPSGPDAAAGLSDRQIAQLRAVGQATAELAFRLRG
jgi:chromate reductase, NAD(P)H dehydrogenase (quinone)